MSEPTPEALEVMRRTPPDLWRRVLRKLRQAEADPSGDGRQIHVTIALDRDGRPTRRGTFVEGPREFVGD